MKRIDDARVAKMHALYREGYSLAQVAKVFGGSHQSVRQLFLRRGLGIRPRNKELTDAQVHKMRRSQGS